MKRLLLVVVAMMLCNGCTYRTLFGLFDDSYSEGGDNYMGKRQHFQQQVDKWEGY